MLAEVLKGLAGQMADMTNNRSYSGVGHGVKETYDIHVPSTYKRKFYLEKLPAPWNVMPRTNAKDSVCVCVCKLYILRRSCLAIQKIHLVELSRFSDP
jgi:hypothetical protein